MYLKTIQFANFKNYDEAAFEFSSKVNAIVGENGSGKTNLLDAIHYLSFCKSYFSSHDSFSIRFEKDFFAIHGEFVSYEDNLTKKISCTFKENGRKTMKVNMKEYGRLSDHIGQYPLIMVAPYGYDLINDGSEIRRKFFDVIISQFDKEYLHQLIDYQKIISQRNIVLKQFFENGNFDAALLNIYNEQLIPKGIFIFEKRKEFVESIIPIFQKYYNFLSENKEVVGIKYQSPLLECSFEDGLKRSEHADYKAGFTTFGIHKDDYLFFMNDKSVKRFGSQGQQKSFTLSLKLSQFDYIYAQKHIKPILLLDDIFDKLDIKRISQLLNLVGDEHFGQVFITDTDGERINSILKSHGIENKLFNLNG